MISRRRLLSTTAATAALAAVSAPAAGASGPARGAAARARVTGPTVEYVSHPLGLDTPVRG